MKFFIFFVSFFFAASLATPVPDTIKNDEVDVNHPQIKRDIITVETPNIVNNKVILQEPLLDRNIIEVERPVLEQRVVEVERPVLDQRIVEIERPILERQIVNVERPILDQRLVNFDQQLLDETLLNIDNPLEQRILNENRPLFYNRRIVDVERPLVNRRIVDLDRQLIDRQIINLNRPLLNENSQILLNEPLNLNYEMNYMPLRNRQPMLRQNWNILNDRVRSFGVQPVLGRRNFIDTDLIQRENRRVLVNVERPWFLRRPQVPSYEQLLEDSLYRAPLVFPRTQQIQI